MAGAHMAWGRSRRDVVIEPVRIDIQIRTIGSLFSQLDPSPFHEKAIDPSAVDYIVAWARDYPTRTPVSLRVHVTGEPIPPDAEQAVASAVRADFGYRAASAGKDLRYELWQGRVSFEIAVVFLTVCVSARELIPDVGSWTHVLREGIAIVGWVAMWQPIHAFLYGWWPILRRQRLYEKLRDMPVELRPR